MNPKKALKSVSIQMDVDLHQAIMEVIDRATKEPPFMEFTLSSFIREACRDKLRAKEAWPPPAPAKQRLAPGRHRRISYPEMHGIKNQMGECA